MSEKTYETTNLALCPFLSMNGLEFIGCSIHTEDENKIVFVFKDPHNKGKDLAMLFPRSAEHIYHELWSYFRGQLANTLKNIKKFNNKNGE